MIEHTVALAVMFAAVTIAQALLISHTGQACPIVGCTWIVTTSTIVLTFAGVI